MLRSIGSKIEKLPFFEIKIVYLPTYMCGKTFIEPKDVANTLTPLTSIHMDRPLEKPR